MMKALSKAIENTPYSEAAGKVDKQFDELLKPAKEVRVGLEGVIEELDGFLGRIERRKAA